GLRRSSQCESEPRLRWRFPTASASPSTSARNESGRRVSYLLRSRTQNAGDQRRHAVPLLGLRYESAAARRSQPVKPRLAFIVRFAPLAGDPAVVLQSV